MCSSRFRSRVRSRPRPCTRPEPLQILDNPLSDRRKQTQSTAEEIVRKQPDQVAMQVAQWMSE